VAFAKSCQKPEGSPVPVMPPSECVFLKPCID
jgi:hypothetical protein